MGRLFHRIYLSLVGVAFAGVALTALVTHEVFKPRLLAPLADRLEAEALHIARELPPAGATPAELEGALVRAAQGLGLSAALTARDGRRLAATSDASEPLHAQPFDARWLHTPGGLARVVPLADGRRLVLRPASGPQDESIFWVVPGMLFVSLAVGCYPVARRLTRRLEALEAAVRELGSGRLATRIALEGDDEVTRLGASFNWAAERIERLVEAQGRVLANASHELRSPLARLRMALELIRDRSGCSADRHVAAAVEEVEELDGLVEDILISSRIEAGAQLGELEPVDLKALLAAEAQRVGALAVPGPALTIRSEARPIRRMLRNLLENARRYGRESEIEAAVEALGEGGSGARIWVADRGPGVSVEERARIFERFYRARGAGRAAGSGLGLALVREIAEHCGGGVTCRPREGGGTVFEVTLRDRPTGQAAG